MVGCSKGEPFPIDYLLNFLFWTPHLSQHVLHITFQGEVSDALLIRENQILPSLYVSSSFFHLPLGFTFKKCPFGSFLSIVD